MKCILSTGLGRLHLLQSSQSLHEVGVEMEIIQGWVPRRTPESVINLLGRFVGSRNLAVGLSKRRLTFLNSDYIHTCALADFYSQGLLLLNRFGLLSRGEAARNGWRYFGRSSAKYIRDADILHVRSGAGRGGAIAKAKRVGMKVVVDQSIAHPVFIARALEEEDEGEYPDAHREAERGRSSSAEGVGQRAGSQHSKQAHQPHEREEVARQDGADPLVAGECDHMGGNEEVLEAADSVHREQEPELSGGDDVAHERVACWD